MSVSTSEIGANIVKKLQDNWGGRLPSWQEFREINELKGIRVNGQIANAAMHSPEVSRLYLIVFGYITLGIAFLMVPIAVVFYFVLKISLWWITASVFLSYFLFKVSRLGHCQAILEAASQNENFYNDLVKEGAFLFEPKKM